jgi:hypothetical protein
MNAKENEEIQITPFSNYFLNVSCQRKEKKIINNNVKKLSSFFFTAI